jgi:hypothetical protein
MRILDVKRPTRIASALPPKTTWPPELTKVNVRRSAVEIEQLPNDNSNYFGGFGLCLPS